MKARYLVWQQNWRQRPARERQILLFGALLLAPIVTYFLLWQPAHTANKKLSNTLPTLRIQADRLHSQAAEIEKLRHLPQPAVLDANALKAALEESASSHQLRDAVTTLDTQEPNAVRITLASVSFEQWLGWLRDLQQIHHVRADSISIAPLPTAGLVRINATLSNGSAL